MTDGPFWIGWLTGIASTGAFVLLVTVGWSVVDSLFAESEDADEA